MVNPSAPPAIVGTPDSEPLRNIVLVDKSNPRAIINLVPKEVAAQIEEHVFTHPELFQLDEKSLAKALGVRKSNQRTSGKMDSEISVTDNRLRLAFWMEYDRAMETGSKMNMVRVFGGVCVGAHFNMNVMNSADKVAWLLCPPTAYLVQMQEALNFAIEELREILAMPTMVNGKVDTKLGELKLKIMDKIDNRVKGALLQRIETKSVNLNLTKGVPASGAEDMAAIEAKIAELEKRALGDKPSVAIMPDEVLDAEVIAT